MPDPHAPGERSVLTPAAFLLRGLAVGLAAGLVAFLVAFAFGEQYVDRAIALEETASAGSGHHDHGHADDEAREHTTEVPRDTQRTWGLLTGTLAIGVTTGGIVALASAFAVARLGALSARQATGTVALVGFVALALVPFLKHPANPPAVGSAETIGTRTAGYFGFQLVSVVAAVAAVYLATRLWRRIGGVEASLAAGAAYLLLVVVAGLAFPAVTEAEGFPAELLWDFRVSSLLTLASLWAVLGAGLVLTVGRLHDRAVAEAERRALAASL